MILLFITATKSTNVQPETTCGCCMESKHSEYHG
jgi:hypothetical protein